ncbi:unnamed protein product [Rhizoctonia solani]|uniref:F-box domain-containing protein n=1 Tax=Rhizoctonia solani TaxID=456999 RepID=A0A8H2WA56_9AGAM|nr:unnamed protein product [Rhizoctonia solani]
MQTLKPDRTGLVHPQSLNPLLLPEIAQWIYRLSTKKDGYHLARVCSHLFNSLISLVWEDVNGVEQLLSLVAGIEMSVDTTDNIHIYMTRESVTDEDLKRFRFYAPFVKRLDLFNIEKYFRYRIRGWKQLLAGLGNNPLLPNLRSLSLNTRPTVTVFEQQAWFMLLISPSLLELNLITTSINPADLNSSVAQLFFESLSTTLMGRTDSSSSPPPNQTTLIRTGSKDLEDISWFTTLRDLGNLSKLTISISALGAGGLSIISLLPRLEYLELDYDIDHTGEPTSLCASSNLSDVSFPRLSHFGLTNLPSTQSFDELWSIKPLVSHLKSATLYFSKYRWMGVLTHEQIMADFIIPISETSPDISDLAIHPPEYEWNEEESSAPMFGLLSRLPLTGLWFAPIISLHISIPHHIGQYPLLRRLELTTSWVEITDVKSLAIVFPNLEYLGMQITIYPEDFQGTQIKYVSSRPIVLSVLSVFLEEDPFGDRTTVGNKLARLVSNATSEFITETGRGKFSFLHTLWPKAQYLTNENNVLRYKFTPCWATTQFLG